jgi:hypothetical protein
VSIFNQWHAKVYSAQKYDNTWNGGGLPDGTYYYIIKFGTRTIKGYILVMR